MHQPAGPALRQPQSVPPASHDPLTCIRYNAPINPPHHLPYTYYVAHYISRHLAPHFHQRLSQALRPFQ